MSDVTAYAPGTVAPLLWRNQGLRLAQHTQVIYSQQHVIYTYYVLASHSTPHACRQHSLYKTLAPSTSIMPDNIVLPLNRERKQLR